MRSASLWSRAITHLILLTLSLLFLIPYLWAFIGSFLVRGSPFDLSDLFNLGNYGLSNYTSLNASRVFLGFLSSFIVSTLGSSLAVVVSFLGAYTLASPLSRRYIGGWGRLFTILISLSLLFPSETKVIVNFLLMRSVNLVDTYSGIYLPSVANLFTFLLFYQALLSYPKELEEAALLEGMSPLQIALYVVMPSLRGVLATAFAFNFVALWNDFLWPLIIVPTNEFKQPLQVVIVELVSSVITNFGHILAATTLASIPVVILFLLFRDSFTNFELS